MRQAGWAVVLALGLAACDGASSTPSATPATPSGASGVAVDDAELRVHWFRYDGPALWNDTLYYATGDAIDGDAAYTGTIVADDGLFSVTGPEGAPYHVRSERTTTGAERRLLWMAEKRGTLGPGSLRTDPDLPVVEAPGRSLITFLAPSGAAGPDRVTLYHEETGTCATVLRDPLRAMFLGVWDAEGGNVYRHKAPPRPFDVADFRPGTYVVGARLEGRQWTARRAELTPGKPVEIDAGGQPEGGGRVICEDPGSVLLLDGELGVPAPRITIRLHFRNTWEGVPPGTHTVRYADGREVDVEVEDGETVRLAR